MNLNSKSKSGILMSMMLCIVLLSALIIGSTFSSVSAVKQKDIQWLTFQGKPIRMAELKVIPYAYQETIQQQKKVFLTAALPDSIPVKDWATGEITMQKVLSDIMPVAINGKPILGNEPQYLHAESETNYQLPKLTDGSSSVEQYLFRLLAKDLATLDNGTYVFTIDKLVIDENGMPAYFENPGIALFMGSNEKQPSLSNECKKHISEQMATALHDMTFQPAVKNGLPVNVRLSVSAYQIQVKNHVAQLSERTGC